MTTRRKTLISVVTVAMVGVLAGCGSNTPREVQSSGPASTTSSTSTLIDPISSRPVPDFTAVTLLPAEACSESAVPIAPVTLPPGSSFPPSLPPPAGAQSATEQTALVAADSLLPNTNLNAPVSVRLESWQDVIDASNGALVVGKLIAPQRCVWAATVHQQNSGLGGPAITQRTYPDFEVVIDQATGYQVDQGAGVDLTGGTTN
jgi:hypothetical protein